MYNLNVSGSGGGGSGMLSLPLPQGESSTTPRTPEILNSLIAMSNPFDSSYRAHNPRLASSPPGNSDASNSSSGSGGCQSPPSVQSTRTQLIKEGLKLTIQSKRRQTLGEDAAHKIPRMSDEVSGDGTGDDSHDGLTPEDEERRRRRRERNKIAATKCRLKKRERTVNLVQESEILENQNHDLKSQIQELETQRRRLVDMLSVHRPNCTRPHAFPVTSYATASYHPRLSVDMSYQSYHHAEATATTVYHGYQADSDVTFGQYSCQTMDQFVKPEIPPLMNGFPSPSFRPIDIHSSVSPGYESGSPSVGSSYQPFDEESEFSGGFSPAGLDRGCLA